ncbi:MAG TPA: DUF3006 domain-containing protein [Thermoanaerobacterales bacterium]|nr:DUF3006 domain-containing protein [Thermoanaerobacterales bacterium]
MFAVIDRFEGEFAIIETYDRKMMNIKRNLLPSKAREGDVIDLESMTVDFKETLRRKDEMRKLAEDLFTNDD